MRYSERATRYCRAVLDGRQPAGELVHAACQRHMDDLERAAGKRWPYRFDAHEADRVCAIVELLPHTKGKWARGGELIRLQDWQCFVLCVLFGWLRKKDGRRRFRRAYLEIPRKNGKSIIAAAIGLIMWAFDGEFGAEVYSGATTEKQAWEVFTPARLMVQRSEQMREAIGAEVWAKSLVVPRDASKFEPIIGKPGDGASPSCAIVDEFHEHDTSDLVDTMETGMGAREQPLLLMITTAGYNLAGPCFESRSIAERVLRGVVADDGLFGLIYSIDESDDWASPASLRKANPNFGVSVDEEFLLAQQRAALTSPTQQTRFKTKHLNVWCAAKGALFNLAHWQRAADPMLSIDDCAGLECWLGADLASKSDLCTLQALFRRQIDGRTHYYLFGWYWLPEAAIDDPGPNQAVYRSWVAQGRLIQTEGATVDFELIDETVVAQCKALQPEEFVYDPFNATRLAQAVLAVGVTAVEFTQTPQNFAVPVDELQSALTDGRLHHDGNPITTWCIANTVGRPTRKGLMAPTKNAPEQKIDGAIAAIMALSRAVPEVVTERSYWDAPDATA